MILGALRARPRSGYEIKQLVDSATRFFWAASYGQIYPELRRLEQRGLISGQKEPRGGRQRVVYSLTPAGRTALEEWLRSPDAAYELRDERLLKLFFADALGPEATLDLLQAVRRDREAILSRLREIEQRIEPSPESSSSLVLEYGIALQECVVDWCKRAEQRLAARQRKQTNRKAVRR